MSIFLGFVALAIALWAIHASIRIIRRIGFRRYGAAVGRLGWDVSKVSLAFLVLMGKSMRTSKSSDNDVLYNGYGFREVGQLPLSDSPKDDEGRFL
jgi:hypothetical protein